MVRLISILAFVALASLSTIRPAISGDISVGSLIVENPWARATPKGAKVGAGYLSIFNIGKIDDRLVSATSDVSDRVEIHSMTMTNGIMKMRRLPDGLAIKSKKLIDLKPGGYHLMFVGLKAPLKKEQSFNVTLNFEKTGEIEVLFLTTGIGGKSPYPSEEETSGSCSGHTGSQSGQSN